MPYRKFVPVYTSKGSLCNYFLRPAVLKSLGLRPLYSENLWRFTKVLWFQWVLYILIFSIYGIKTENFVNGYILIDLKITIINLHINENNITKINCVFQTKKSLHYLA